MCTFRNGYIGMKKVQQRDSQIGNEFKKKTQLKKGTYDLKGKGTHQELNSHTHEECWKQ